LNPPSLHDPQPPQRVGDCQRTDQPIHDAVEVSPAAPGADAKDDDARGAAGWKPNRAGEVQVKGHQSAGARRRCLDHHRIGSTGQLLVKDHVDVMARLAQPDSQSLAEALVELEPGQATSMNRPLVTRAP
jgi:hypothetical protein